MLYYYTDQVNFSVIRLRSNSKTVEWAIKLTIDGRPRLIKQPIHTQGSPPNTNKNSNSIQSMWVEFLTGEGYTPEQIRDSFRSS
jgi:hypothetical protein